MNIQTSKLIPNIYNVVVIQSKYNTIVRRTKSVLLDQFNIILRIKINALSNILTYTARCFRFKWGLTNNSTCCQGLNYCLKANA